MNKRTEKTMKLYYIDEQHKKNHKELIVRFPETKTDNQFLATTYICAVPDIFRRASVLEMEHGPFDWLISDFKREETGELTERLFWLKDFRGEYLMSIFGLLLWGQSQHGNKFYFPEALLIWTPQYYNVFKQALDIFRLQITSIDF